jgi:hypothetical protein
MGLFERLFRGARTGSGNPGVGDEPPGSDTKKRGLSPLADLIASYDTIVRLNMSVVERPKEDMPRDVMVWFGKLSMIIVNAWQRGECRVSDAELKRETESYTGKNLEAEKWQKAVWTQQDVRQPIHFLLLSPDPDRYLVNYPGIVEYWATPTARAHRSLYGGPETIREPATPEERAWCERLRKLNEQLKARGR